MEFLPSFVIRKESQCITFLFVPLQHFCITAITSQLVKNCVPTRFIKAHMKVNQETTNLSYIITDEYGIPN